MSGIDLDSYIDVATRITERDEPPRRTDTSWLADFHARIPLVGNRDEWTALDKESRAVYDEHRLDDEDWQILRDALFQRGLELKGSVPA